MTAEYPKSFYAWYVVAILMGVQLLSFLDRLALSLLIIPIQNDLRITDTQMGLLLGPAFVALYVLAGFPLGYLCDRYSRRNILLCGVIVWCFSTAACGVVSSFDGLLLARAGVGAGEACVIPAIFSLIADYFPPERRGRATAVVTMGISLGSGLAFFGGGALLSWAATQSHIAWPLVGVREPWELVFLACGAPGLIVVALLTTVKEPARQSSFISTNTDAPQDFGSFMSRDGSALLLVLLAYTMFAYAQYAHSAWAPTLLSRSEGLSVTNAAYTLGLVTLIVAPLAAIVGGVIGDRFVRTQSTGRLHILPLFGPWFLVGAALVTLSFNIFAMVGGMAIIMFVGGMISASVYSVLQDVSPAHLRGRVLASYGILGSVIGLGLGPAAVALTTDHVLRDKSMLNFAMLIVIAPSICLALLLAKLGRRGYAAMLKARLV